MLYPTHNIAIVSGRHDTCCNDTCDWFEMYKIPLTYFYASGDELCLRRHCQAEHLGRLLKAIHKGRIAFVLDDRPKVVNQVWRNAGIKVYPVGGMVAAPGEQVTATPLPAPSDLANAKKGFRRCPSCGALEDF